MLPDTYAILAKIRSEKPLIHHITNWVTIYDCAAVVRAAGALPVMAHAREEAGQMAGISSALVLNIGTLTSELVDAMVLAGETANCRGIPVVLDAVGAGATSFRTEKVKTLLGKVSISILKGNAGEIATVAGETAEVKGVESVSVGGNMLAAGKKLSKEQGLVVAITGRQDLVIDSGRGKTGAGHRTGGTKKQATRAAGAGQEAAGAGKGKTRVFRVNNGHEMMGRVVGTGCMAASLMGAFAAVEKDYAAAAASALSCFGIAGELAAKGARGPGTYKERLYDELCSLTREKIEKMQNVELEC